MPKITHYDNNKLFNTDNIWGYSKTHLIGNAENINGNAVGISGEITNFSGCCSRIIGRAQTLGEFTYSFDNIQDLIAKYNIDRLAIFKDLNGMRLILTLNNIEFNDVLWFAYYRTIRDLENHIRGNLRISQL